MSTWFRSYGFADVHDELLIGAYPLDDSDVAVLEQLGIDRILNLVEDEEYETGRRPQVTAALKAAGIEERRMNLTDFGRLPPEALEVAVQTVVGWLRAGDRVYLHCRAGWQRSPAVAAGVVAVYDGIDINQALAEIQVRKPSAEPLEHQREDLLNWWRSRSFERPGGASTG
ncbi:MAG TPA: dual specificity protein phosphatase family protein [Solirubrobacteraceae bacterium]